MTTVKTGSSSIVLGSINYRDYIPYKNNKLLKITKITDKHNEFKLLDEIKKINYFRYYYTIPEDNPQVLENDSIFYSHIQKFAEDMSLFNYPLHYFYIDYAGDTDLLDTIENLINRKDFTIWKNYNTIIKFSKHILEGLHFLHQRKICHLDIKPENIMVNSNQYKIIDFGFASMEPFTDYLEYFKGTPGYFPSKIKGDIPTNWLPKIDTDDMIPVNNIMPYRKDIKLVYKVDSYCFGRVLFYLKYIYKENKTYGCFSSEKKNESKLNAIIDALLEKSVVKRVTAKECLNLFFNTKLTYNII